MREFNIGSEPRVPAGAVIKFSNASSSIESSISAEASLRVTQPVKAAAALRSRTTVGCFTAVRVWPQVIHATHAIELICDEPN